MSDRAIEKHDVFGKISIKLAFLLNKGPEERVLLIGKRALLWGEDFQHYFSHCEKSPSFSHNIEGIDSDSQKYGLVLWDMTAEDKDVPIEKCFAVAHGSLTESGSLVLISNNRYSARKIKQFLGCGRYRFDSSLSKGLKSYKNLLNKSGFPCVRGFLPLPSVDDMEDIVADEVDKFQLPDYFHIIQKIANACGFYDKIHDGYILLASVSLSDPIDQFLQWLEVTLSEKLQKKHKLRLVRFDLRKRGALVIFVADAQGDKKYVVRVAVNNNIDAKIKKNGIWINRLQNNQAIPEQLKNKVPAPILHSDYLGRDIYIETMLPGILAWKIIGKNIVKTNIDANAFRFIYDLNSSTKNSYYVDEQLFDHFLQEDINILNESVYLSSEFKSAMSDIVTYVRKQMLGKTFVLAWAHGDYGYGNIFINEKDMEIVGVIDWEGARSLELPGVDMINMRIQGGRSGSENSLLKSFKNVVEDTLATGRIFYSLNNSYENEFHMGIEEIKIILLVTSIRFIAREVQYPIIIEEAGEFMAIISFLRDRICYG